MNKLIPIIIVGILISIVVYASLSAQNIFPLNKYPETEVAYLHDCLIQNQLIVTGDFIKNLETENSCLITILQLDGIHNFSEPTFTNFINIDKEIVLENPSCDIGKEYPDYRIYSPENYSKIYLSDQGQVFICDYGKVGQ